MASSVQRKDLAQTAQPVARMPGGSSVLMWAILGYVTFVPTLSIGIGPYNEKRALQIGLFILVGGVLLLSQTTRRRWLKTIRQFPAVAKWGLSLVFGGGLVSALKAPALFYALLEVGHFLLLFVTAGIVASAVQRAPQKTERRILGAVALGVLLYAVFFFFFW